MPRGSGSAAAWTFRDARNMPTVKRWLSFAGHYLLTKGMRFETNARTNCSIRNCSLIRFSLDTKPSCRALRLGHAGVAGALVRITTITHGREAEACTTTGRANSSTATVCSATLSRGWRGAGVHFTRNLPRKFGAPHTALSPVISIAWP